jgi:hypothetical protein
LKKYANIFVNANVEELIVYVGMHWVYTIGRAILFYFSNIQKMAFQEGGD